MRTTPARRPSQCRSTLPALALAAAILSLLLVSSGARAVAPVFNVDSSTVVVDTTPGASSDIESEFNVGDDPWPAAMYQNNIGFLPTDWGIAAADDLPIGAIVGKLSSDVVLGWFNNPCSTAYGGGLSVTFDPLMNCSVDTSDTVAFADQFVDTNGDGLQDGCDKYPEFLNTMFPGLTPVARMAGFENIGINTSVSFVVFEPGTSLDLPGLPTFPASKGYVSMSVFDDPTGPLVKNQITDFCPPLTTDTVNYGLSLDNPQTVADESGYPWRTNPAECGTYTFYSYVSSIYDADGDNIDNGLDTCPHIANEGDPRVKFSGDNDNDGLDNACDPTPDDKDLDVDGDGFPNRQDNCPLVFNEDQANGDFDGIGDACDQDDWNDDGDITDPGEPTGFDPDTPNNDNAEVWTETEIALLQGCDLDYDNDGVNDAVDLCPDTAPGDPVDANGCSDAQVDTDGDGVCDPAAASDGPSQCQLDPPDNCPLVANSGQEDNEGDGLGDVCDDDDDNDGFTDDREDSLGSDPLNANSTPEHISLPETCIDGIDNDLDGLPDLFDCDSDEDGIANYFDACPFIPEDIDGYQDDDGCPDPDNDGDGRPDDEEGSMDTDGDTVPDTSCILVPEDYDAFEDWDGCPEPDNDGDYFPDYTDDCPGTDDSTGDDGIPCTDDTNEVNTCEDYDGVIDTDGCHDSPGDDYDGDSLGRVDSGTGFPIFWDEVEVYLGTDPLDDCPDDPSDDAWPLDISIDGEISVVGDVLNFRGRIGATSGDPNWWQRLDLNADGEITVVGDVLLYRGRIGETCT